MIIETPWDEIIDTYNSYSLKKSIKEFIEIIV